MIAHSIEYSQAEMTLTPEVQDEDQGGNDWRSPAVSDSELASLSEDEDDNVDDLCPECEVKHIQRRLVVCADGTSMVADGAVGMFPVRSICPHSGQSIDCPSRVISWKCNQHGKDLVDGQGGCGTRPGQETMGAGNPDGNTLLEKAANGDRNVCLSRVLEQSRAWLNGRMLALQVTAISSRSRPFTRLAEPCIIPNFWTFSDLCQLCCTDLCPADEIFLFGFSRGACTADSLLES